MAKAQVVEYTYRVGPETGVSYTERKYLLETFGEQPLVIMQLHEHVLVFPFAKEDREEVLNYNLHHIIVAREVLGGKRRIVKEIDISDDQLASMVQYLESIKPVKGSREYFGKVLRENQPGPSHGASRFEF